MWYNYSLFNFYRSSMSNYEKYTKPFQNSMKGKFSRQKANAAKRGISWEITFDEWKDVWEKSGKWNERGRTAESYCMSRLNDVGPYSVKNVEIKKFGANSAECFNNNMKFYRPPGRKMAVVWEHRDNPTIVLGWKHPYPLEAYPNGYIF